MKAITLWQPWASWIAWRLKTIETRLHRRFSCLVGERIAIHAGLTYDRELRPLLDEYYRRCWLSAEGFRRSRDLSQMPVGCIMATARVAAHRRLVPADWRAAMILVPATRPQWGLHLENVVPLHPPIPVRRGYQGAWTIRDPELVARLATGTGRGEYSVDGPRSSRGSRSPGGVL